MNGKDDEVNLFLLRTTNYLLTGNSGGLLKNRQYLWVQLHLQLLLLLELGVASLYLLVDPLLEWLADDCVDDITQPLSGQLLDLFGVLWQDEHDIWIVFSELKEVLDLESFEMWEVDDLNIFAFDVASLLPHTVPQVPDG